MEEAERLCDRVAIMDHGKVIALGTPRELIASIGADHVIEFSTGGAHPLDPDTFRKMRRRAGRPRGERQPANPGRGRFTACCRRCSRISGGSTSPLTELRTHSATLEDVFVSLTGQASAR